ncbi:SusC/RagA family TonB-linked outer membrane protein, partial [Polaribacter sp.]|nr:SusC/RagA family TonB-linked outer membrane protein [Polaribacter sp.]
APVYGVNVIIKGTGKGTLTDFDGKYTLNVAKGKTLIFSYLGLKDEERVVKNNLVIDVTMEEGLQSLDEVVVTALGIKRAEKTLGYSVSSVKSEDLEVASETDVLQALQGKISGVQITGQGGGIGASTKIIIRGMTRIGGSNTPLWVVDGVPISDANDFTSSRITGSTDYGNRAQDLNPDDIESITVLKGASAAALYGSRASNGVIVVTTKKAKGKGKATVSYNSTLRFDSPLRLPDFQNTFGPGNQGSYDEEIDGDNLQEASPGWGPAISDGGTYTDYAGNLQTFESHPDLQKNFYASGVTKVNNFSISGASNDGLYDYRLSSAYTKREGIIPGSSLDRLNLGFKSGARLYDNLSSVVNFNYVNSSIKGAVSQGGNDPNLLMAIINRLPRTTDISVFTPWISESGDTQLAPVDADGTNNPYWVINENQRTSDTERFFGNVSLDYKPIKNLSFLGRVGYDTYNTTHFSNRHVGTIGLLEGSYRENHISRNELTLDFLSTYENSFGDFDFTARGGAQWNQRIWSTNGNLGTGLTIPELFDPGNVESNVPFKNYAKRRILGVFSDLTLTYKEWLTLNATARNDWSSTLPQGGNSYFYPSVALSFIFTEAFNIDSAFLSYGKLRANWANVGSDTGAYQLDFLYSPQSSWYGQFSTTGTFPFDGQLAFSGPNTLPNVDLRPENQANYELGVELGFFGNRLTLDATYYKNVTTDQIISLLVPSSTGYSSAMTNVGQISNGGIELELGAKIIRYKGFRWNVNTNFSTNTTIVDELGEGIDRYTIASAFNGLIVGAEEGEAIGIYGNRFARAVDADGNTIENQILVNSNGLRYEGNNERLGNLNPDFTMGLTS